MNGNTRTDTSTRPRQVRWTPGRIRDAGTRIADRARLRGGDAPRRAADQVRARLRTRPDLVEGLATDELERDLVDLAGRLAAGTYELLVLVGEYDDRNTWALRGALSCAAWLADLCDIEISTARTQIGVAKAMRDHPLLDTALAHGDISYSKARRLVPYLDGHNDTWVTTHQPVIQPAASAGDRRPDASADPPGDHPSLGQQRADALVSLLIHDAQRRPVDASPRRRYPTRRQQRIIDQRHPECAHPGCHARTFLQHDHVQPYTQGGATVIANLQRLCDPHDRAKGGIVSGIGTVAA